MRVYKLILFVLTFLLTFNCNAAELVLEPQAMLYYRVPLGGGHGKQMQPTFGFRLDRTLVEKGKPVDYRQLFRQQAVLDFRMDRSGVESLTIGGVDYLKQYRALNAAEEVAAEEATAEEIPAEEATAEEVPAEEEPGFFEDLPEIFEENQRYGLLI